MLVMPAGVILKKLIWTGVTTPYSPSLGAYVLPNKEKVLQAARELLAY